MRVHVCFCIVFVFSVTNMRPLSFLCVLLVAAGAASAKSSRIVGGQDTSIEKYPSIVQVDSWSLFFLTWSHFCGASILTTNWLVSAAHCFQALPAHRRIRAGSTHRNAGGVVHYISYVLNHPEYTVAARFDADINLVRLDTPLVYTPVVQRVTIISQDSVIPDGTPVVHAGWGATSWGGWASPILQDVQIYVINNRLCAERYLELNPTYIVTENMICAGLLDIGGRDACQGDSGGPLYYGDLLVGVVSWGHRCANDTYPGVSTAVSSYTNWMVDNAR